MAKKKSKDDFMNFIAVHVNPGVNATWLTREIQTGVTPRSGYIMAIHKIQWHLDFKPDSIGDEMDGYLGTVDINGSTDVNDGIWAGDAALYCIDWVERRAQQNVADAAANMLLKQPISHEYDPPIAVAHSKIYMGGFTNGVLDQNVGIRIGFTYKKVTTDEYFEAIESLKN